MTIFIEDTAGDKFECDLEPNTTIGALAAEFFESMKWPELDGMGRGQRAVVELVPIGGSSGGSKAIRLKADQTLADAQVHDTATLRIFPESIAGSMDVHLRNTRLVSDLREIDDLCEDNEDLDFEANDDYAPNEYIIYMYYESFIEKPTNGQRPKTSDEHKVEIKLPSEYPLAPPRVKWLTPIFHPNIHQQDRTVCLGQLQDRFVPSMGLARVVLMLAEIAQWRNFDIFGAFNQEAARWASQQENWKYIAEIGGTYFQIPRRTLIDPRNWGGAAPRESPFFGQPQPENLRLEWEMEKQRPKIEFRKSKKAINQNN